MSAVSNQPRKPTIWIVDDSATERALTERVLRDQYHCVQLSDGSELIEKLQHSGPRPDLILLDWVMPGVSGPEACRFMQSRPDLRSIPVVFVTATRTDTDDIVRGLALGAKDYLPRPFVPEELRARVATLVRAKHEADELARERARLSAINRLMRAVFAFDTIPEIARELVQHLKTLCDGCSVVLFPSPEGATSVAFHSNAALEQQIAQIGNVADPGFHAFESREHALASLPPLYHDYIQAVGLRSLAILPLPSASTIRGVLTVTRDGDSEPFDTEDLEAIGTCADLVGLAITNVLRLAAERDARAEISAVLEHAPIGIVVTNQYGTITLANPAASKLIPGIETVRDPDGVHALADWATADGRPIERADWRFGRAPASGQVVQEVLVTATRRLAIVTVALGDRDAQRGSVTTIEDVTTEHALAADRQRVAEFQERMVGIVGHDLRSPLGALVAGLDLLAQLETDDPTVAQVVPRMKASSARMTNIIDQLLDVTRARLGGGIPVHPRACDISQLLRSIVDEHALAHPMSKFELLANGPIVGLWDPDRLEQALGNLLGNAVSHGRRGEPIAVELAEAPTEVTIRVRNSVRDNPLRPEQLASLFDPFRRGDGGATTRQGLGLGLFIASEIVRAHGGSIDASSAGYTIEFRLTLPRS